MIGGHMIDRTTKFILIVIAFGLFANAITPLLRPVPVAAQQSSSYSCNGKVKVNVYGPTEPQLGGYDIALDCH
jgi:hypothetical protein